jgi:hypothetical protein
MKGLRRNEAAMKTAAGIKISRKEAKKAKAQRNDFAPWFLDFASLREKLLEFSVFYFLYNTRVKQGAGITKVGGFAFGYFAEYAAHDLAAAGFG